MAMSLAAAAGPFLGGVVVQLWDWQAVYWMRVPLALATLALSGALPSPKPQARPFDAFGAVLVASCMSSLLLSLVLSQRAAAPGWLAALLFVLAMLLLLLYVRRSRRAAEPIIRPALFADMAGVQMTHIPYKGTGPALTDTISGQTQLFFSSTATALPHVQSGALRVLAVTTRERLPTLAAVPTIAESGLPAYDVPLWHGMIGPAGIEPAIIARLSKEMQTVLHRNDVRDRLLAALSESLCEGIGHPPGFGHGLGKQGRLLGERGVRAGGVGGDTGQGQGTPNCRALYGRRGIGAISKSNRHAETRAGHGDVGTLPWRTRRRFAGEGAGPSGTACA